MIASAHLAAGVVAGMTATRTARGPLARIALAVGLGVLSHVALDALPHSDYGELGIGVMVAVVAGEALVTGSILWFILRDRLAPGWPGFLLAGVAGSALPDAKFFAALVLPPDVTATITRYGDRFHEPFHAGPSALTTGIVTEVAATLVLLAVLTLFPTALDRERVSRR
jgi:hypothetical protein